MLGPLRDRYTAARSGAFARTARRYTARVRLLRWSRRRVAIPALGTRPILGVWLVWALVLLVVDVGPRVRVVHEVPLLRDLEPCRVDLRPAPAQILTWLPQGAKLRVRRWHDQVRGSCYAVETVDGQRGFVAWDPTRIDSAGIHVGVRREFRNLFHPAR